MRYLILLLTLTGCGRTSLFQDEIDQCETFVVSSKYQHIVLTHTLTEQGIIKTRLTNGKRLMTCFIDHMGDVSFCDEVELVRDRQ